MANIARLICVIALILLLHPARAGALDAEPLQRGGPVSEPDIAPVGGPDLQAVKPFTAALTIDSPTPVVVGDDIIVSVRITANVGIEIHQVNISLKGAMAAIYPGGNDASMSAGECTMGQGNLDGGRSTIINCRLTSPSSGMRKSLGIDGMIDTQSAQVEIEVKLKEGIEGGVVTTQNHYEYIGISFVSPKTHVIAGGLFGAILWAIFLTLTAQPVALERKTVTGWRSLRNLAFSKLPDRFAALGIGSARIAQRAIIGGITALVLIVLAKSTEGFEPPISIRIQDFWGGMMIGILSTPLAKWLREKLSTI
jgi:hypothetical protein